MAGERRYVVQDSSGTGGRTIDGSPLPPSVNRLLAAMDYVGHGTTRARGLRVAPTRAGLLDRAAERGVHGLPGAGRVGARPGACGRSAG